ncbi:DUF4124 domain-containing protein [Marinimicrobium sp. ARAG 43.8]|uniref:DUF4124 domain-containing protein n=1 Tax=Marinimicrobium sp. ARAG 43.8 TaxID=3418719 RepID=UPI003CEB2CDA
MRTLLPLLLLCLISLPSLAQPVYKSVDEHGRVTYSDKPPREGRGEAAQLPPVNTVPAEERRAPAETEQSPEEARIEYRVQLVSPAPESSVPPGQRNLPISVQTDPPLAPGHVIAYYMDDELLAETSERQFVVQEIFRGTHQIVADVIDAEGQVLGSSETISVHVHRPSLLNPNRR